MAHIHKKYDFVVTTVIVHDNKVLLVHHPRYGKWLFPGGHIELDEDPEQALYREIAEETGLKVTVLSKSSGIESPNSKPLPAPNYLDSHDANAPHKHIGLVYFCVAENNRAVMSAEHRDMRWLSSEDLEKSEYQLEPTTKFYAREALGQAANRKGNELSQT